MSIRAWLIEQLCLRLGLPPDGFDTRRPFRDYGLDSIAATRLIAELGARFDRQLSPTLIWEHPTVDALADWLGGSSDREPKTEPASSAALAREPIAIIGLACRFPGAENAGAFWALLRDGVDAITEVPPDRWNAAQWCDPDGAAPGRIVTRRGGFLRCVDRFDADFFGISPREAAQIDPQQRLMLELSWESLEAAGIPPERLRGSRTGVFFGAVWRDYAELQAMEESIPTAHTAAGQAGSIIANRVSYTFGFEGPSLAVDTACSSSLVAVHLACQSLQNGESEVALAGGVLLLLSPRTSVVVSAFGGLSADGACRTFDARASGYVRGEGAGVVVLKRLSRALADGDPIVCVIRGSAVNNDGATNGLTAPNLRAQAAVLREAWAVSGRDASEATFVELHGTGTPLGDPIEARALSTVLCAERPPERPLAVGSVKTNIGHLEAAAGIAGLIKVALALRYRAVPPSLHFEQPNPLIDFDALRLSVQRDLAPLARDSCPVAAGVSSFGFGGTNCHVVMEEYALPVVAALDAPSIAPGSKMAFVFGGGGTAWLGMARDLLHEPAFYAALRECDATLRPLAGWSVIEALAVGGPERLHDPAIHLPSLFAVQVALARLWQERGYAPASVVGYSVGEWAAAHVAGILAVEDGIRIASAYARALRPVSGHAAMGVVGLPAARTSELLEEYGGQIAVSADNGPASSGIGGGRGAIARLAKRLADEGVFCRIVEIDGFAHIPAVEPLLDGFAEECRRIPAGWAALPMVSTVTGTWITPEEFAGSYWPRNFREPVAFARAMETLIRSGHTEFIEISPHPSHIRDVKAIAGALGQTVNVRPSLERGRPAAEMMARPAAALRPERTELLVLSARSAEALDATAGGLPAEDARFRDLCYTAAVRREHHEYRLAIPAKNLGEAVAALPRAMRGRARQDGPKLAFVFSGQGALGPGMARQLFADEPVFRAALLRCNEAVQRHTGWSLVNEIHSGKPRLDDTDAAQPLLFAIQVALAALWADWGIRPDGVAGHSVGEIAAAHVAGALSLEDAARIVAHRGRLMQAAKGLGAMAAVAAQPEIVPEGLWVAAINSPSSIVVSGTAERLHAFLDDLRERGIEHRKLPLEFAFHSPQMEPYVPPLIEAAADVRPALPKIPAYSTVTGGLHEQFDAPYWGRNLREPVRFAAAIEQMRRDGFTAFLEIGPHAVLQRPITECAPDAVAVASQRSSAEERGAMLAALGKLYTLGARIRWERVFHRGGRLAPLPAYPWQRRRYWFEGRRGLAPIGVDPEVYPLLGRRVRTSQEAVEYECEIVEARAGALGDHRIYEQLVVPAASHIARLLCAAREVYGAAGCTLEDLTFPQALAVRAGESRWLHLALGPERADGLPCRLTSLSGSEWITHAAGRLRLSAEERPAGAADIEDLLGGCPKEIGGAELYRVLAQQGLHLGQHFQWIEKAWAGEDQAVGRMRASAEGVDAGPLPAGLIDSCFQLLGACLERHNGLAFVPLSLDAFRHWSGAGWPAWCHMRLRSVNENAATADFRLFDEHGSTVAEALRLTVTRAPRHLFLANRDWFYEPRWIEAPNTAAGPLPERCVVLGGGDVGGALAERLGCHVAAPAEPLPEGDFDAVLDLRALDGADCEDALALVQRLARAEFVRPPRLWLVTRGAQSIAGEAPDLRQAKLWGFANAIEAEHPEWNCARVDLDPGQARMEDLLAALGCADAEARIAFRGGKRYAARLERVPRPAAREAKLRADAAYLITGGIGVLGLETARWMVEHGARHLMLMGRRGPAPEAAAAIRELERRGAAITVERGDVCQATDVEQICGRIRESGTPLAGVVHAAGELADGVLVNQTWDQFRRALAPKTEGAWNLHQATAGDALDFFVLFSSVAALMPAAGQANYAAGNAYLDAMAHFRRAHGLPAMAINWGPWGGAGMAARTNAERMRPWRERGIVPLAPDDALNALGSLLFSGTAQCAVFRQVKPTGQQAQAVPAIPWDAVQAGEQRGALEQFLREHTAALLGLAAGQPIDPDRPLRDLGFDSLMALNLRTALATFLGRKLPATLVFDYPTLAKLAEHLLGEAAEAAVTPAPRPAARVEKSAYPPDAVAVIGMACRFPGGGNDPEAYWRLLRDGVDAISEVPPNRWDVNAYFDANRDAPGKMYSRWGGFLSNVDGFDAGFFGIAPREARGMDPQQRLLLEVTWEALESAGQPALRLGGSSTGVFVGFCLSDYAQKQLYADDARGIDAYSGTGSVGSVAAGRLSYFLGIEGPSMAVDTACSSSLVSVHLACQSLRAGECEMALAGGVNLLLSPNITIYFSKLTALAPDGRCKAFDAAANGYVRGEGCGMLVLKPLAKALADGDRVLAVIRGSAVNQDGRSNGLTAPSRKAQERVIRAALEQAKLQPHEVGYVEAHGTGTPLGDPIEIGALAAALCRDRAPDNRLRVGSVKTNIGHLEGAAGVAGLIKAILALRHREIPPHLHLQEKSPHIPWSELPIDVPVAAMRWETKNARVAGVSSFGFSGTNAHVILQEPPPENAGRDEVACYPFVLSAKTPGALDALVDAWRTFPFSNEKLAGVAYTAAMRRTHHEHRVAVAARSVEELREALSAAAAGRAVRGARPRLAFVFAGHGSQWLGMGEALLQEEPIFRETIERCAEAMRPHVDWVLTDQLRADPARARLSASDVAQPALFAMQVGLAALWRSWGVEPEAIVGHSSGEIAAAHVAGALSLEEAAAIVCHRSRLVQAAAGRGAMLAVEMASEEIERLLDRGRPLWIAAQNSPTAFVLSGEADAVDAAGRELGARGVYCRRVDVDYASHCPLMEPFRGELVQTLNGLAGRAPHVPIYSTVTGRRSMPGDFSAEYWGRHLQQPVQFRASVDALIEAGIDTFLSIDPHPVLAQPIAQCLEVRGKAGHVVASGQRGHDSAAAMKSALGRLFTLGYPVDWERQFSGSYRVADLPAYPWEHQRYWIEAAPAAVRSGTLLGQRGTLLGRRVRSARSIIFETELSTASLPFLEDHRAYGTVVAAGACHLAMAACAARELWRRGRFTLTGITFPEALVLPADEQAVVQLVLAPEGGAYRFEVLSECAKEWRQHASGVLLGDAGAARRVSLDDLRGRCRREVSRLAFYEAIRNQGVQYGAAFQWIDQLWQGENEALGRLRVPEGEWTDDYVLHPGLIDSCFQLLRAVPVLFTGGGAPVVPVAVDSLTVLREPAGGDLWAHLALTSYSDDVFTGDMTLCDEAGDVVVEARGLTAKRAPREFFLREAAQTEWLYEVAWEPASVPRGSFPASCAIIADQGGVAEALAARLESAGVRARVIRDGATAENAEGIVYLRALDCAGSAADCEGMQRLVCGGVAALLPALGRGSRLWLVTRGAFAQASLWGLGHSLAEEMPEVRVIRVDLDPRGDPVEELLEELRNPGGEDRVSWREAKRSVPRLVRSAAGRDGAAALREDGAYLITGGLGALGLAVANWMARHGAGRIVLMGRTARELPAGLAERATVALGDIACRRDVERVLSAIRADGLPLRGIVHAAGILDDGILAHTSWERFYGVMRPKVAGAWHLHELTAEDPLDFFVMFSSATAVLGSAGQASHAAANAFLDALAFHRRAAGLPAVTMNWGPWAEIGQAAAGPLRGARLTEMGFGSIRPEQGIAVFGERLYGPAQTIVLPVDWRQWQRANPGPAPAFLSRLVARAEAAAASSESGRAAILRAAPEERRPLVRDAIAKEVRGVLQLRNPTLDGQRPLVQFGLDSLMALELRRRIDRSLGVTVPLARILGGITLDELAALADESLAPPAKAQDWAELEL